MTTGTTLSLKDFPRTNETTLGMLYDQLRVIHEVCSVKQIKYWVIGETLLGQVRHGTIIPWNDNNDVGIRGEDKEKLLPILNDVARQNNMVIKDSVHGLKVSMKDSKGIGTDIFFYHKESVSDNFLNGRWVLHSDRSRKNWPKDWFLDTELDSIIVAPIGPTNVCVPGNPLRYLHTLYGSDCMCF